MTAEEAATLKERERCAAIAMEQMKRFCIAADVLPDGEDKEWYNDLADVAQDIAAQITDSPAATATSPAPSQTPASNG